MVSHPLAAGLNQPVRDKVSRLEGPIVRGCMLALIRLLLTLICILLCIPMCNIVDTYQVLPSLNWHCITTLLALMLVCNDYKTCWVDNNVHFNYTYYTMTHECLRSTARRRLFVSWDAGYTQDIRLSSGSRWPVQLFCSCLCAVEPRPAGDSAQASWGLCMDFLPGLRPFQEPPGHFGGCLLAVPQDLYSIYLRDVSRLGLDSSFRVAFAVVIQ